MKQRNLFQLFHVLLHHLEVKFKSINIFKTYLKFPNNFEKWDCDLLLSKTTDNDMTYLSKNYK